MLVLSRTPGQAIVVGDEIVVTLERCAEGVADLTLANARGVPLESVRLLHDQKIRLTRDVDVILIKSSLEKVRLGFEWRDELSASLRIERKEDYDRGRGLA